MLWKWTNPRPIAVSFKNFVEYQLQVTPKLPCTPTLFSESQSKEWQLSDTMLLFFYKANSSYCSENCIMNHINYAVVRLSSVIEALWATSMLVTPTAWFPGLKWTIA